MTIATARKELKDAKAKGFCPYCFAGDRAPGKLVHKAGCKIINDACLPRKSRN